MKTDRKKAEEKEFTEFLGMKNPDKSKVYISPSHEQLVIYIDDEWKQFVNSEFVSQQLSRERVMDILEAFDMYLRKVYGEIKFNYDDAMRFVMNNDLCEGEEQPTDEEIINHIIKNCRHKEPPEIMMDEQAYFEGAKAMRDKQIKTN